MTSLPTPYAAAKIAAFLADRPVPGPPIGTSGTACGACPRTTPTRAYAANVPRRRHSDRVHGHVRPAALPRPPIGMKAAATIALISIASEPTLRPELPGARPESMLECCPVPIPDHAASYLTVYLTVLLVSFSGRPTVTSGSRREKDSVLVGRTAPRSDNGEKGKLMTLPVLTRSRPRLVSPTRPGGDHHPPASAWP